MLYMHYKCICCYRVLYHAVHALSPDRYPGNYGRYLEMKEARIAAEDADADRARTKLRRESEWMAKQPRARQAKSKARQQQFYELVDKAKGREADKAKVTNLVVHYLLRDTLA